MSAEREDETLSGARRTEICHTETHRTKTRGTKTRRTETRGTETRGTKTRGGRAAGAKKPKPEWAGGCRVAAAARRPVPSQPSLL